MDRLLLLHNLLNASRDLVSPNDPQGMLANNREKIFREPAKIYHGSEELLSGSEDEEDDILSPPSPKRQKFLSSPVSSEEPRGENSRQQSWRFQSNASWSVKSSIVFSPLPFKKSRDKKRTRQSSRLAESEPTVPRRQPPKHRKPPTERKEPEQAPKCFLCDSRESFDLPVEKCEQCGQPTCFRCVGNDSVCAWCSCKGQDTARGPLTDAEMESLLKITKTCKSAGIRQMNYFDWVDLFNACPGRSPNTFRRVYYGNQQRKLKEIWERLTSQASPTAATSQFEANGAADPDSLAL